jgi:hypothetical protein
MPKEVKHIRINLDEDVWKFEEKNEDMTTTIKNKQTGEEIDGIIKTISTTGTYTIEIVRQRLP